MPKKLYIKTYGCQMNVYDSEKMADVLAPIGYGLTDQPETADMVILNTCHIREKASEKVYSELGRLREMREMRQRDGDSRRLLIAVAGCVAQAEGAEIMRRAPAVDIVLGPQTYHRLPEMVARAERAKGGVLDTDFPVEAKFDFLPESTSPHSASAFLTVQEGCDKFCSFCVVPYTRGAEFSRPTADIEKEAWRLVERGVIEITLLGQNVNAFHGPGPDGKAQSLADLILRLAKIEGLKRLRYTTSHPLEMDDSLIEAHADCDKLMPFLHLPVQSGSDRILTAMNRRHTVDAYLQIVEKLRRRRPDIALSSDFIVGFPGESEADFEETLRLAEQVGFAQAYTFKYSPRPGTPAAALLEQQVPEAVKDDRLARLQETINKSQFAFNQLFVGQRMAVLFERRGRRPGQWIGRSPYMQAVHANLPDSSEDRLIEVVIDQAGPYSLAAHPINNRANAA